MEKKYLIDNKEILKEWNYEKNNELKIYPDEYTEGSSKKVWWICSICGFEWETSVKVRTKGHNCPKCAQKRVGKLNSIPKKDNLTIIFPEVCKEWDYKKNYPFKPEEFAGQSNKRVWWKCSKCGTSWKSTIASRVTSKKVNCKKCNMKGAIRKATFGKNDLETKFPKIAKEWDYEKNYPVTPKEVLTCTLKKYYWKCSKGHSWLAAVTTRTNHGGTGCPICSYRKIKPGINDLATTCPDLLKQWNYKRNTILPTDIAKFSNKKVWWKCDKGHEWEATPNNRNNGKACPYCSNSKILSGYNDFATISKELLEEWDYEKNLDILPTQVGVGSSQKVWWMCKKRTFI